MVRRERKGPSSSARRPEAGNWAELARLETELATDSESRSHEPHEEQHDNPKYSGHDHLRSIFGSQLHLRSRPQICFEFDPEFHFPTLFGAKRHTIDHEEHAIAFERVQESHQLEVISRQFSFNDDALQSCGPRLVIGFVLDSLNLSAGLGLDLCQVPRRYLNPRMGTGSYRSLESAFER